MYLEYWIHNNVKEAAETDPGLRTPYSGSGESLRRSDIERYHNYRLSQVVNYAYRHSLFYRELFETSGLSPADIRRPGDLPKLPFTESHHLAESPYSFLCTSQSEIARPHTFVTSGTTGPRKKIFWTRRDLERIIDFMSAGIGTVAKPQDVVLIMLPDGRDYSQADLLRRGVKRFGATPVVAEMDIGVLGLKKMVEDVQPSVIFGYTRHLFRLSRDLQLREDMRGKKVRTLFLAAEYLPPGMRSELEKIWDCSVHTHYGLTEMGLGVAVECDARNGYHFNEADLLLEVVNPHTGEPVEPGQEGELVFTTLNREAMPLIRYRTNDISRLIKVPCPCGAKSLLKIGAVKKRLGTILQIGAGDEIFPAYFDDLLFEVPGIIDYQLIVTRRNNRDQLGFRIETMTKSSKTTSAIREKLLSSPLIARNIAAETMAPPRIEMVAWGTLQTLGREKRMITDSRQ